MTPEAQRIAIAEFCGLVVIQIPFIPNQITLNKITVFTKEASKEWRLAYPSGASIHIIPDYLADLNEIHKAEKLLSLEEREKYQQWLYRVCEREHRMAPIYWLAINSAAQKRAEALLRTIGKWKES